MSTLQELRLKRCLRLLAACYGAAALACVLGGAIAPLNLVFKPPFVINAAAGLGALALVAFFASADVRRFRPMILTLICGNLLALVSAAAMLLWGETGYTASLLGREFPVTLLVWASLVFDALATGILLWLSISADRSGYPVSYLSPLEFRTLASLAEVVVAGKDEVLSPQQVACNVDRYLTGFDASSKWIMKAVLTGIQVYPLLSLRPPFSYMNAEDRLAFIKRRFYYDVTKRLVPAFWRTLVQGMIRMGKQLCYLGYYNDPRTYSSVGYTPYSLRDPDGARKAKEEYLRTRLPLAVQTPAGIKSDVVTADVVIVGSGAGAAVLAAGLLSAGREVLMIERGDYADPAGFTEDEARMLGKLYRDGALQLTRDFRFQVLQGSCVGGTTVINNAVCFDLPDAVLHRWNDPESLHAGLDAERLRLSFLAVRDLVGVTQQNHDNLNLGASYFIDGIRKLRLDTPPGQLKVVEANIQKCLGCGYCNIGCGYGRKLSMLDRVLPSLQRDYNQGGREGLRILAGCEAGAIETSGKTATSVTCRLKDGRKILVKGKLFVLSAGAVSSSLILLRSKLGNRHVGKHLSFNAGSPMTAVFDHAVNSYEGLQISHYLELSPSRGYVLETWFNPPLAQALNMPGWFDDHYKNMHRYNRMTCSGVLVGTESNAEVRSAGFTGREIDYVPTAGDLQKVVDGLVLSGEIFFQAGASSVMPGTFDYYEFKNSAALAGLRTLIRDSSDLTLGTGHPQGGNRISSSPEVGVIDPNFRVYGHDNLFVCDASVFPGSIGVNPQLTVMALAHYAAPLIARS